MNYIQPHQRCFSFRDIVHCIEEVMDMPNEVAEITVIEYLMEKNIYLDE